MAPPNDKYLDTGKPAGPGDATIIQNATSSAILLVNKVVVSLQQQATATDPYLSRLIYAYFKTKDPADVAAIKDVFTAAQQALNANTTYVVDRAGFRKYYGVVGPRQSYYGETDGWSTGTTNLGLDFFNAPVDERPATLVHEAIHRSSTRVAGGFRYQSGEKYVVGELFASLADWNQKTYSDLKKWVDVYAAFAQGFDDKDYFGKWGGLPKEVCADQMIGTYKDLDRKVREAQELLTALGLYNGPIDGNRSPDFDNAMTKFRHQSGFPRDGKPPVGRGGGYNPIADWDDDVLLGELRRARQQWRR